MSSCKIKDIQTFVMSMTFISSSEVKIYISGVVEATNEMYKFFLFTR